jgi:hypothetical protein
VLVSEESDFELPRLIHAYDIEECVVFLADHQQRASLVPEKHQIGFLA